VDDEEKKEIPAVVSVSWLHEEAGRRKREEGTILGAWRAIGMHERVPGSQADTPSRRLHTELRNRMLVKPGIQITERRQSHSKPNGTNDLRMTDHQMICTYLERWLLRALKKQSSDDSHVTLQCEIG
jgi:hypothetical protein